jgi:hypothetical protein
MSISHQVLGQPGRDNALFVEINTGQSIHRLQFDCGEACLRDLPVKVALPGQKSTMAPSKEPP